MTHSSVEMSLHKTTEPLDRERTIQEEGRKIMMNRPRKDENRDPYSGQRREGRGQMTCSTVHSKVVNITDFRIE